MKRRPSIASPKKDSKALAPLHRLARHKYWDEISCILKFEPKEEIDQWLEKCRTHPKSPIQGGSPLHVILLYKPPVEIVNQLIHAMTTANPNAVPEDSIDLVRGQTPLHIAVATGCAFDVIERLTTRDACQTLDTEQRTPLHSACTVRNADYQTVELIVRTFPMARKMPDCFNFTPLNIAQYHHASPQLYKLLLPYTAVPAPPGTAALQDESAHHHHRTNNDDVDDEDDFRAPPMFEVFDKSMGNISILPLGVGIEDDEHEETDQQQFEKPTTTTRTTKVEATSARLPPVPMIDAGVVMDNTTSIGQTTPPPLPSEHSNNNNNSRPQQQPRRRDKTPRRRASNSCDAAAAVSPIRRTTRREVVEL